MANRTYPNSNFAWYNDDNRIAIVCVDTTDVSGEKSKEKYDTYQDADVAAGLRITFTSKFETVDAQADDLKTDIGLDSGLHPALVCYIKTRLLEDLGDLQKASYFKTMYEKMMKQYPTKKSGVRTLAVPKL